MSCLSAADFYVRDAGELQSALNGAAFGDTITLEAGRIFSGNIMLPAKAGSGWITLRSSAMSQLPADGNRVNPSHAAYMPKIVTPNDSPALTAINGAHGYRIMGVELRPSAGNYSWQIVALGYGNETSLDTLPYDIELDRVYIHGDPTAGTKRGITLNSKAATIKNSYISDIKSTFQDCQAIMGWNGPGPYKIINNYLEASGENIMFGGGQPAITNVIPSDIEIRRNYMFKPLSWRGTQWQVKNLLELKSGRRVTIDGNILENNWANAQTGFAVLFTPRTEMGGAPWITVEDVVFTRNIIRHAGGGISIGGIDDQYPGAIRTKRIRVEDNLFEDINSVTWGGYRGYLVQITHSPEQLVLNHNTAFANLAALFFDGQAPAAGMVFTNNIAAAGEIGIIGSAYGYGSQALAYYAPDSVVTKNIFPIAPGTYPAGNYFDSVAGVGFVNAAAGNYKLASTSTYRGVGTTGRDLGVDFDALQTATSGVTTGTAAAPPVVSVATAVSPTAVSLSTTQLQQFTATVTGTTNTAVTWSISPAAGAISASGLYTPPASIPSAQNVTVKATSVADPSSSASAVVSLIATPVTPPTSIPIRLNVGGPTFTDTQGQVWTADNNIAPQASTTKTIRGTTNPTLYRTQRWSCVAEGIYYQIPLPNGTYNLTLKFAEFHYQAGVRSFNVTANGATLLSNFDVAAQAGGRLKAVDRTFAVSVTNGSIQLRLSKVTDCPILNGIEIR